jgi:hypothetical protein
MVFIIEPKKINRRFIVLVLIKKIVGMVFYEERYKLPTKTGSMSGSLIAYDL